ncbi:MAG: hypothetical protein JW727_02245 [Candidatus Aenigmarchaeota archaeon]|nr:hypothetical protein [Candidatus Aenigmarchaeota archaeon]
MAGEEDFGRKEDVFGRKEEDIFGGKSAYKDDFVKLIVDEGQPKLLYQNGDFAEGVLYQEGQDIKLRQLSEEGKIVTYQLKPVGMGDYKLIEEARNTPEELGMTYQTMEPAQQYGSLPPQAKRQDTAPEGFSQAPSERARRPAPEVEAEMAARRSAEAAPENLRIDITSQNETKSGDVVTYEVKTSRGTFVKKEKVKEGADGKLYANLEGPQYVRLSKDDDGSYQPEDMVVVPDEKFFSKPKEKKPEVYASAPAAPVAPPEPAVEWKPPEKPAEKEKAEKRPDITHVRIYLERSGPYAKFQEVEKKGKNTKYVTRPVEVTYDGEIFVKNETDPLDSTYTELKARRCPDGRLKFFAGKRDVEIDDPFGVFFSPEEANKIIKGGSPSKVVERVGKDYRRRGGKSRVMWSS